MFYIFSHVRSNRRRSRGNYPRRKQHAYRRSSSSVSPFLILLVLIGLIIIQPRLGPVLFFLIPLLFFWFFANLVSALFRRLSQGAAAVEEFWSEHLGDESLDLPPSESALSDRPPPPALTRDSRLSRLWQQARDLVGDTSLNRPAQSVLRQVHALADLFERFQDLLRTKLRPDEVTYQRFLSSGTQGYEMIVTELQEAVSRMEHLRSVGTSLRPTADEVAIAPESFQQIQQEQLSKIDRLLSGTQDAVAQLARVTLSIAEMRGISQRKAGDITNAINQLKDLAQRAGRL